MFFFKTKIISTDWISLYLEAISEISSKVEKRDLKRKTREKRDGKRKKKNLKRK